MSSLDVSSRKYVASSEFPSRTFRRTTWNLCKVRWGQEVSTADTLQWDRWIWEVALCLDLSIDNHKCLRLEATITQSLMKSMRNTRMTLTPLDHQLPRKTKASITLIAKMSKRTMTKAAIIQSTNETNNTFNFILLLHFKLKITTILLNA